MGFSWRRDGEDEMYQKTLIIVDSLGEGKNKSRKRPPRKHHESLRIWHPFLAQLVVLNGPLSLPQGFIRELSPYSTQTCKVLAQRTGDDRCQRPSCEWRPLTALEPWAGAAAWERDGHQVSSSFEKRLLVPHVTAKVQLPTHDGDFQRMGSRAGWRGDENARSKKRERGREGTRKSDCCFYIRRRVAGSRERPQRLLMLVVKEGGGGVPWNATFSSVGWIDERKGRVCDSVLRKSYPPTEVGPECKLFNPVQSSPVRSSAWRGSLSRLQRLPKMDPVPCCSRQEGGCEESAARKTHLAEVVLMSGVCSNPVQSSSGECLRGWVRYEMGPSQRCPASKDNPAHARVEVGGGGSACKATILRKLTRDVSVSGRQLLDVINGTNEGRRPCFGLN